MPDIVSDNASNNPGDIYLSIVAISSDKSYRHVHIGFWYNEKRILFTAKITGKMKPKPLYFNIT